MEDCLFCGIVAGKIPSHKIWEDDNYIAFLTIFPNTDGFTVVATKEHTDSDAFQKDDKTLAGIVLAAKKVAKLLVKAFDDVGRAGMFIEGYGVNHLHVKLFPMHGTPKTGMWQAHDSSGEITSKYFEKYEGYLSSHNGNRMDDEKLAKIAQKIRSVVE